MENKTPELHVRALLLDLDGTLVDSHAAVLRSWRRWAGEVGVTPESFLHTVHGRPGAAVMAEILPHRPAEQNAADDARMLEWELADTEGVRALPGAARLTAILSGLPWAIVTACNQPLARARLAAAGLPEPSVLVTSEQLGANKPDPEGYRTAAQRLGIDPAWCAVAEDAPAGVRAGIAAGMPVIGLGPSAASAGPTWPLRDLDELEVRVDGELLCLTADSIWPDEPIRTP